MGKRKKPKKKRVRSKFGFDTKHASHLIRLSRSGVEILKTGTILVKRPDAEELLGIRNGTREFEDIEEEAINLEKEMEDLYQKNPCKLPKNIDCDYLDELVREFVLMSLQ